VVGTLVAAGVSALLYHLGIGLPAFLIPLQVVRVRRGTRHFLVAATAAFALGGAVVGTLLPQLGATIVTPQSAPGDLLCAALAAVITVLVLFGFLHGTRRGRVSGGVASTGRWLMLAGLGGWIGFLLVSRLAVLLERIGFLLGDWLGIA
jgi:hypothetical protein